MTSGRTTPQHREVTLSATSWRELDQRMAELEQLGWTRPRGTSSVAEYGRVTYFATMRKPLP
jgi:hypothetical protein